MYVKTNIMNIQQEINNCPTLSFFINSKIDYEHFDNQVNLKCFAIREALYRSLNKIHIYHERTTNNI